MLGGIMALLLLSPELDPPRSSRYELSWEAPEQCPRSEQVRARVDELLALAPGEGEAILVDVEVVKGESGYLASLQLREGRRELGDPDCHELAEAVALIIALAVDPELLSREPEQAESEQHEEQDQPDAQEQEQPDEQDQLDAQEPEQPEQPEQPEAQPEPRARANSLRGFGLALRAGASFATIAPASARVQLSAASFGRLWRAELGITTSLPQRIDMGRFSITAAALLGCYVPELRKVEFPLCAGLELGAMTGVGRGRDARRAIAPWFAATPSIGVSWVVLPDRLALGLRADALLPLLRPAFASDEGRLLVRAGFGAQALGGLELRFGARWEDRAR